VLRYTRQLRLARSSSTITDAGIDDLKRTISGLEVDVER
jgi:hypothetical protein